MANARAVRQSGFALEPAISHEDPRGWRLYTADLVQAGCPGAVRVVAVAVAQRDVVPVAVHKLIRRGVAVVVDGVADLRVAGERRRLGVVAVAVALGHAVRVVVQLFGPELAVAVVVGAVAVRVHRVGVGIGLRGALGTSTEGRDERRGEEQTERAHGRPRFSVTR
jgi:hypothetical protein